MGAVTRIAALRHLTVRRFRFDRMARSAAHAAERPAVSLVTASTVPVSSWRALMLLHVTGAARRRNFAGVRLVTARTLAVPSGDLCFFRRVTGLAAHFERHRSMRQTAVAALAFPVAAVGRDQADLPAVTTATHAAIVERAHEIVGLMALATRRSRVEGVVGGGDLMAAAAASSARLALRARRMWIVAADARSRYALFGMVRLLVAVTIAACSVG
jgi:hypothetical protein